MTLLKRLFSLFILLPWVRLRAWIIQKLLRLQARLKIGSLRNAIQDADRDKAETGRKNMVVFNTVSGDFEPVQKRLLKHAARKGKNKSNKAHTPGRRRQLSQSTNRILTHQRVRVIEKRSPYVTR